MTLFRKPADWEESKPWPKDPPCFFYAKSESESHSVMCNSATPWYSPWNFPGQNTGVVIVPFSRGSSQPRDWTQVSHIAGGFFTSWATRKCVSCSVMSDSETTWTVVHQAPLSMGFSWQEYWSQLPFPSPEDLPDQGSNLSLPHCRRILTKWGGSRVKHFLVSVRLQRECVNFCL